jgi:hypothetical protein
LGRQLLEHAAKVVKISQAVLRLVKKSLAKMTPAPTRKAIEMIQRISMTHLFSMFIKDTLFFVHGHG